MDLTDARMSYDKHELNEKDVPSEPFALFRAWFDEAIAAQLPEPYAMSLATCGADMRPSVRIVLLRELTDRGVVFYTNYDSEKGQDIHENANAEVLFFWHTLERQVRFSGRIEKVDAQKSVAYFAKRPKDSQIGAWVSQPQSGEVQNRDLMTQRFDELSAQFGDNVPYPSFWGGYELVIEQAEFWQGRSNRMHDRIRYTKNADAWQMARLLP